MMGEPWIRRITCDTIGRFTFNHGKPERTWYRGRITRFVCLLRTYVAVRPWARPRHCWVIGGRDVMLGLHTLLLYRWRESGKRKLCISCGIGIEQTGKGGIAGERKREKDVMCIPRKRKTN